MTEDTSPENLRKFLESDDPAMVMMGLSMAKGSGLTEDVLPTILRLYMWNDNKTIRAAAKSFFIKHAPNDVKTKVKENWKPNYRTLSVTGDKYSEIVKPFLEAFKSQDDFALIALEPLIKALGDKNEYTRYHAAIALGEIGDKRAVEPLIKALRDKDEVWDVRESAVYALGKIGDGAVEPLIKFLGDEDWRVRSRAAIALDDIGDKLAVEPLIKALEDEDWRAHKYAAEALVKIGDKRAVEPLIKTLGDKNSYVRIRAAQAIGKIGDKRAVEPLIKALSDDEPWVRGNAAEALGEIGDKRAVEPLIKALEDEVLVDVHNAAKKALKKLGHEVVEE